MCAEQNNSTSSISNTAGGTGQALIPDPTETLVAANIPDGYWLEAFYFHEKDKFPDLIGYGLGFPGKPSIIVHYVNPKNSAKPHDAAWEPIPIQTLDFPVSMAFADFTGDGFNDIVICDHYGPSMDDLWDAKTKAGGRVQYLKNPGDRLAKNDWQANHIGTSTGMHRVKGAANCERFSRVMSQRVYPA
ncbi:hypothetical protein AURDEDRAFT_176002 [Auricularia subglabra TFB-10046 SS5]|uniref:Aldos-2-ulose dehydratase beta-propeller domain-containing protein n=1 Tax=Auricularia subglabra (strain TFB-10046 / SS5) TaxID=717982 RepID=J0WS70_AURST|nr:hypothetical protein AURDEDRAFT_176002 [Auricularia subglabra TFB-10046 SS5]